jgi:hypothetical protein
MKTVLLALGVAMFAGCAHGAHGLTTSGSPTRDERGSTIVVGPRLLLVGPGVSVHASVEGTKTVDLFVVERKHGDDGDCVTALSSHSVTPVRAETTGVRVEVAMGEELCAASPDGPAEISWHAHAHGSESLWALR